MNLNYIFWEQEASNKKNLDWQEFSDKCKQLDPAKKRTAKTVFIDFDLGDWFILQLGKYVKLFIFEETENGFEYNIYWTHAEDDSKNVVFTLIDEENGKPYEIQGGTMAYNTVCNDFKEQYGCTLLKAFGTVEEEIKMCVPKQFYWCDENYIDKTLSNVSSIDYCSHYPTNLCEALPDAHKMRVYSRRMKPTQEYPFAFYPKTMTIAEYKKYDTHEWINSKFAFSLLSKEQIYAIKNVPAEEDVTVLMKPAKYNFDLIMAKHYKARKTDSKSKLVMNAFIGMLHTQNYLRHKYAHLAAISIARSNEKMRKLAETRLQYPIHICVDGCIYLDDIVLGVDESKKGLGKIEQEFYKAEVFRMKGSNIYVAMSGNKVLKFKHGAFDGRDDGKDINDCTSISDMEHWIRIKKTNLEKSLKEVMTDAKLQK